MRGRGQRGGGAGSCVDSERQSPAPALRRAARKRDIRGARPGGAPAARGQKRQRRAAGVAEDVRAQRAESSARLASRTRPRWKALLALPADVCEGKTPTKDAVTGCVNRYNVVTTDARYQDLSPRRVPGNDALLLAIAFPEGSTSNALKLSPPE